MQEDRTQPKALDLTPVSVALNRPDIQELDAMAVEQQTNRSALVRQALQDFLGSKRVRSEAGKRFRTAR